MDALVSAVVSDFIGRLVSFLIGKYQERSDVETAGRLQRALVRARVVVEEAEGRQLANRAMVQQLNQLRRDLSRAVYALDTFRGRAVQVNRSSHGKVSRSATHTRPLPSSYCPNGALVVMVQNMEAALSDMREFIVLLGSCPRITRQPYSVYLCVESCMFGRQMEKEQIINFLLQPTHQDLDVLPIIGPHEVGKRTLVEHVCLDERVRGRFAKIHRLTLTRNRSDDHDWSLFDFTARSLMVIDIVNNGDADAEESWILFHAAVRHRAHTGSKIIFISRTEAHSSLGTVPPLRLRAPCREELWYFFRALAFGSADPNERPDLVRIAMALCEGTRDFALLFAAVNIIAASLRADLSSRSWRRLLKVFSEATLLQAGHYFYLSHLVKDTSGSPCLFYNSRKLMGMVPSDLPEVTMLELLTKGSLPLSGETQFDVLVWQSRIPPYTSYIATCDTDKAHHQQQLPVLKKRPPNKRRRDHQEDGSSN